MARCEPMAKDQIGTWMQAFCMSLVWVSGRPLKESGEQRGDRVRAL